MMRFFLGIVLSIALAFVSTSVFEYYLTTPNSVKVKPRVQPKVQGQISSSINIADKVVVKKTVSNTDYLNAWKLTATVLGSRPMAMVLKGTESKILHINDSHENYKVKKIEKEKVLFSSNSDDTWLYIKKAFENVSSNVNQVMPEKDSFVFSKKYVDMYLLKPEKLLKTINIVPEMHDGRFLGMKVKHLLEGSFLYRAGLRQEDLIQKINGKRLLSIADAISAYQNVTGSRKFSITVLRDNKIEELKYEIVK